MSVKSRDVSSPTPFQFEPGGFTGFSIGLVGMAISAIFWIFGARWSIDGLIVLFNTILRFLTIPYQAPIPPHYLIYAILCPVPVIFSAVEWRTPFRQAKGEWQFAPPGHWLVWGGVMVFDFYTTFLGLGVDPGPEAVTFMRQLAASVYPRAIVSFVLTVGPEWLARSMMNIFTRLIRRK